ncbi:WD domain, G-beta repeat-containing protein [Besnoitia besnoiti]|uniref:WD domain, G-beta repeat-containing protein n=1 Tax=Besnoitia besnoiti TaxID=94643 RepID=A0A2A9MB58_BESBE|nr:WD domain, G-beta repeat-containing protein [Besnoitia besnoiti]PFH32632.1 WD domain, G-beta repeat-containing protein [Besnoitia besnoiti]
MTTRLVSTSGRPVHPGDICPIRSTQRSQPSCPLPLFPAMPFLLHPHRPLLFWCTATQLHAYDFARDAWPLSEAAEAGRNHELPVTAADCVCQGCGATSSGLRLAGRRAPETPRCAQPATLAGASGADSKSRCLWVTAGDDKYVHLLSDGEFCLLQKRQQRKKLSAAVFLPPASSASAPEAAAAPAASEAWPLLLADKFGDVYRLADCSRMSAAQELAGDRLVKRMKSIASVHGLRTRQGEAENCDVAGDGAAEKQEASTPGSAAAAAASSCSGDTEAENPLAEGESGGRSEGAPAAQATRPAQAVEDRGDEEGDEEADGEEGDIPIISHLTTVTVLKVVHLSAKARSSPQAGCTQTHTLLITADRDEKIRICFLDQPWSVESFFLGHGDFVTDVVVLADGLPASSPARAAADGREEERAAAAGDDAEGRQQREALLEGQVAASCAADGTVKLWKLKDGSLLCENAEVLLQPRDLFDSSALALVVARSAAGRVHDVEGEASARGGPAEEAAWDKSSGNRPHVLPTGVDAGVLLPASLVYDPEQSLLTVNCLGLQGLLLFPLGTSAAAAATGMLGKKPFFLPLPAVPSATLLVRHSAEEIEGAPALNAAAPVLRAFRSSPHGDAPQTLSSADCPEVPFVWWIDEAGRLRPPVAVSLPLLAFASGAQKEVPCSPQVLPYLCGNANDACFPAPGDDARPNYLYLWKSTRSPTCPTDEERRAKRLRHKHLQQQQQQEMHERLKNHTSREASADIRAKS